MEAVANYYLTRRHITADPHTDHDGKIGHGRRALCSTTTNVVEVFDQAQHDKWAQQYQRRDAKPIADLPLCKKCERKAAKDGQP